ncbi:MAG: trehalase family glycosidase [Pseudomonadota bacterium]
MSQFLMRSSWWTWNADLPAEVRHLESGFTITPVLYAASTNATTRLRPGPGVVFGPRPIGESAVHLDLSHAGTSLEWQYGFGRDGRLDISWRATAFGEWGLRFWVVLCFQGPIGVTFTYDPNVGLLAGAKNEFRLSVLSAKKPLMATFHNNLEALEQEFFEKGYFYLASRGTQGHFAALRFNLEEGPEMALSIALSEKKAPVLERPLLPDASLQARQAPKGRNQEALEAVHDVMAWNHVYDSINDRPYTVLSRFWNSHKFGGFGVWLDDVLYNALLWGHFDLARAIENLDAVFAWQTEAGNFPCLVTGNDAWLDRSQPPIASYVIWALFLRSGDRALVSDRFEALLKNHDWWWEKRSLGDTGLVAFGTSLDAGDGLYKGTKLAAKDESTMDNSPLHDLVPFDEDSGLLLAADVGVNSLLALDGEILVQMAALLGHQDVSDRVAERVHQHKARIADWLWDDSRGVFANRMRDGTFVRPIAPTSFYPLVAGIGSPDQIDRLLAGYLEDPDKFGGDLGLPSITRDDPAFSDNVYWRGRIWGPLNYWVYQGLRRMRHEPAARALAEKSWRLFEMGWRQRCCGENYNAESGAISDQPDTDTFYSWGALLPELSIAEEINFDPWSGWSLQAPRQDGLLGPVQTPLGPCFLNRSGDSWMLKGVDGQVHLESNFGGRLSHLALDGDCPSLTISASLSDPVERWIAFPARGAAQCTVNGRVTRAVEGRIVLHRD